MDRHRRLTPAMRLRRAAVIRRLREGQSVRRIRAETGEERMMVRNLCRWWPRFKWSDSLRPKAHIAKCIDKLHDAGFSPIEIALMLGLPLHTVQARISDVAHGHHQTPLHDGR